MTKKATRPGKTRAYVILEGWSLPKLTFGSCAGSALSTVMDAWLAALLVVFYWAIGAALMVRFGLTKLKEIDPAPRQTIQTMRENKEWLTQQI